MIIIKRFIPGVMLFFAAIMLFSCNLEDFNLKKLANPDDIIPEIFAPLAYGTFKAEDLVTATISNNFPIPVAGFPLDSVMLSKTGTSFRSSAIDSVYLIIHFTNNTLVDMEFNISFIDKLTGNKLGNSFTSEKIAPGAIDQKIEFKLDPVDQDNLMNSSDIRLGFTLSSPAGANPILYKAVKKAPFTVKISFHAPVNLQKL